MTPLIASLSGLRGIYGEGLTPEVINSYAKAFGSIIGQKIVIGRDTRSSSAEIESLVIKSLDSVGCKPIQLGIATTPTTQIAVEKLNANGGIISPRVLLSSVDILGIERRISPTSIDFVSY